MLRISLTKTACLLPLLALCLSGCGLTQRVSEGTKSAFNAVFYKKINTLHLDFTAREALNTDARENHSLSEPVVVRIYQLKDRQTFDRLVYQQLLDGVEMGIVTLSLEAPDGAGSREVFYLSLAPEEGWMIRKAHQPPEARLILTEDRFFMAVDSLA